MKHIKLYEETISHEIIDDYEDEDYENSSDMDQEVHLEIRLEPHPIDHVLEMNRNEWNNMSDKEKKERVRDEFEELLGEEWQNFIDDGEITFYEN